MVIYLIRHGTTEWNKQSRIQGREDIPMSPEGEAQASRCACFFYGNKFPAVLSSPLKRAVRTAEFIAEAAGCTVITDERLTERDFGSASGKVVDIFNPEKYADDLEPLDDVAERMLLCLGEYAEKFGTDFAVVSHGGAINAVLRRLTDGRAGSGKTRLKNACISIIKYDNGEFTAERYNMDADELKTERQKWN